MMSIRIELNESLGCLNFDLFLDKVDAPANIATQGHKRLLLTWLACPSRPSHYQNVRAPCRQHVFNHAKFAALAVGNGRADELKMIEDILRQ